MKGMKSFLFFAAFALMVFAVPAQNVHAQEIELYKVDFEVISDKLAATHFLKGFSTATNNISIQLPRDARTISVKDIGKNSEFYTLEQNNEKILIAMIKQDSVIEVSYITNSFLDIGKKSYFSTEFKAMHNIKNLTLHVILPEAAALADKFALSVFPSSNAKTETDGQRISVVWQYSDVKKDANIPVLVIFKEENSTLLVILTIAIIILVTGFVVYSLFKKEKKKIQKRNVKIGKAGKSNNIEEHLIDSERAVINALRKSGRKESWQKQIQMQTGFSKAKLSRVIRNLESRSLIKKIPFGNTNKIVLK